MFDAETIQEMDRMLTKHTEVWNEAKQADEKKEEARFQELYVEAGKRNDAIAEEFKKLQKESVETVARLRDAEQKLDAATAGIGTAVEKYKTPGQQVIESEAFKRLQQNVVAGQGITINVDDLYMQPQAVITNPNPPVMTQPLVDPAPRLLIAPATRRLTIRNLIPSQPTNTNLIPFTVENVVTDNTGPQAGENVALGESNITFTLSSLPVETVGTFIKLSEQILEDATALQGYVDGRMRNLLATEEEDQLLLGSGVSNNLTGLAPQATDFDNTLTATGDNNIDMLRHAILQVFRSHFIADAMVLHAEDWHDIDLLKRDSADPSTNVAYIVGDPVNGTVPRLWGLPVIETMAMSQNDFLIGSFALAAVIHDRRRPSVQLSLSDATDFTKLMVTLRVHERLCLTVYRPTAIVTGDFRGPGGGSPL